MNQTNQTITFGSVCSGIEAASVAWHPLGWRASWLAEIEPFPCAVLAHHYPDVPNLGDMTQIAGMLRAGSIPAPDVFCGGTPCQAFSVAGLRRSLDDARGNLSLTFCEIANEIDARRAAVGLVPTVVFWENVPGVLNTKDNAFGCFLAGLAGEDDPLIPAGGKWTNAGCVLGPKRAVAWRVLDAQYFGVAQRRRRVFVVASARKGFDPAAVLFESDGVRRDSAPRREAGQGAAGTLASRTDGGGFPGTDEACSGYVQPVGWPAEIAATLNASFGSKLGLENQHIRGGASWFVPQVDETAKCLTTHGGAGGFDIETETPVLGFRDDATCKVLECLQPTLTANHGKQIPGVQSGMNVRRLTPRECERLQGFPDDYTLIPVRGKTAADGPRYKALGNSWAVPNVRWIGTRIDRELRRV